MREKTKMTPNLLWGGLRRCLGCSLEVKIRNFEFCCSVAPLSLVKHGQDHQQPQIRAFPVSCIPLGSTQGSVILQSLKMVQKTAQNLRNLGVGFEPLEIGNVLRR